MLAYIGLGFAVLTQLVAIVWAASRLSTELKHLADAVKELKESFISIDSRVDAHDVRLSVLEERGR